MRLPPALAQFAIALSIVPLASNAQPGVSAPNVLPAVATARLSASLDAAAKHARHVWRDVTATNADGTVNGYIEISSGDRRKWEFDMAANQRAIDRVMPEKIGGYPINYGFVPQTISYDGDPFDVLVAGPPLPGGEVVRGVIIGLLQMEDDKGLDSKVVISRIGADGRPLHQLSSADRDRIAEYFRTYRSWEPGKFSRVPGWGSIEDGRAFVETTHRFFLSCRRVSKQPCRLPLN